MLKDFPELTIKFNIKLKTFSKIIEDKINLGLNLDNSIYEQFQNEHLRQIQIEN